MLSIALRNILSGLLSSLFLAGLVCCSPVPDVSIPSPDVSGGSDDVSVSFRLGGLGTRSVSSSGDDQVSSWRVYLCEGGVVQYSGVSAGGDIVLTVTPGTYDVYALVNGGSLASEYSSESGLLSAVVPLVFSSDGNVVMFGSVNTVVADYTKTVRIPVDRVVGKVELESVRVDFSARPDLAAKSFVLESVYLINVAGDCTLGGGTSPGVWYNRSAFAGSDADGVLYDAVGVSLSGSSPYGTVHHFYACENPSVSDAHGGAWSPRFTRLVLQTLLGGVRYYYSVDVKGILRNHCYRISEILITDRGSLTPDEDVSDAVSVTLSTSVAWDGDITVEEES